MPLKAASFNIAVRSAFYSHSRFSKKRGGEGRENISSQGQQVIGWWGGRRKEHMSHISA